MAPNTATDQSEIADDIENLVPHEFIAETQWFLAQYRISTYHNRVFETAALYQIFIHERFNIFVVNKCPCRSDLAFENRRRNFHRQKLCELIIWAGLGA